MRKRVRGKDREERNHHEAVARRRDRPDHGRQQDKQLFYGMKRLHIAAMAFPFSCEAAIPAGLPARIPYPQSAPKRTAIRFGVENCGQVSVSVLIRGRRIWYTSDHEAVSSDLQCPR